MENMKLSKIYATAIYEIAKENNKVMEILDMLNVLSEQINENEEFNNFLSSPIISKEDKIDLLNKLSKNLENFDSNILDYLVEKNRISCLKGIRNQYLEIYYEINNELIVTGIFPTELDENQKEKLVKKLEKLKGKKILLHTKIDESIIAGGILMINDEVIDGSLRNQLKQLKESF